MTAACPLCGARVLAGLDAQPHPLGVLGPDGEPLPLAEILRGRREGKPVGRRRHVCPPPGQVELFPIPAGTDKTRSKRRASSR